MLDFKAARVLPLESFPADTSKGPGARLRAALLPCCKQESCLLAREGKYFPYFPDLGKEALMKFTGSPWRDGTRKWQVTRALLGSTCSTTPWFEAAVGATGLFAAHAQGSCADLSSCLLILAPLNQVAAESMGEQRLQAGPAPRAECFY